MALALCICYMHMFMLPQQLESKGGMLTKDGRRRTPGGVFLRLLQDR